jgi:hypothetical protein
LNAEISASSPDFQLPSHHRRARRCGEDEDVNVAKSESNGDGEDEGENIDVVKGGSDGGVRMRMALKVVDSTARSTTVGRTNAGSSTVGRRKCRGRNCRRFNYRLAVFITKNR